MWAAISSIVGLVGLLAAGAAKYLKISREHDRISLALTEAEKYAKIQERQIKQLNLVVRRLQTELAACRAALLKGMSAADAADLLRKPE